VCELNEDPKTYNKPQGNGLGLASAKQYAEKLGGTLTIESRVGVGTAVFLLFPTVQLRKG